jgi:hypothetical protein
MTSQKMFPFHNKKREPKTRQNIHKHDAHMLMPHKENTFEFVFAVT